MAYRLRIELTYTTNNNTNNALSAINDVLATEGYVERATADGRNVSLFVENISDEAAAIVLRNALTSAWGSTARSGGEVSLIRKPEVV